jgi:hypothetical protein
MIVGVVTTGAGLLLLFCSMVMLTYSRWSRYVDHVLHIYDSGKILLNRLIQDMSYEISLFNRTVKAHLCVRSGKTGMMYSK